MATVGPYNSTEYAAAYVNHPSIPGNAPNYVNIWGGDIKRRDFTYAQAATGTADDIVRLCKVPANSVVIMGLSLFKFSAWTASTTLNVGWLAFTTPAGVATAADENGLMDGVAIDAAGHVFGGALILAASAVAQAYIVDEKEFDAKEEVAITATLADVAPLAAATLTGWIAYQHT